ncbi:N-acetylmannosamine kinase [Vibrio hangzhouensis]|uniref:N-acylmannosamine kinase n=1 Tax=Vibrio hangzhouensis TaxID=462991 RepID=A0A1H5VKG5_9VIBR|nr:N-acetylmannosamine kinase [Vibrio hangzhouensis]SEF87318.1 N-acylmannosamine kinase [Vibrio hangzhouensis]
MSTLAIDIGGTKVAIGVVKNGELTERCQIPTPTTTSVTAFAAQIVNACHDWIPQVRQIGISTTGWVKPEGITSINPDTLAFPQPFPLHKAIETLTAKPVSMLNDAQAAAWYEFNSLTASVRNMAYITVSTGVGGGLIIDGKLHKGARHLAGHIGHTVIDILGPECGCGQTGCVEAVASGTAINKKARMVFQRNLSNIELFELAQTEPEAMNIIKQSAYAVATLCSNLKAMFDLDIISLGGGIGLAPGYFSLVEEFIRSKPEAFQVTIVKATGDYDACLLGAAAQF